MVAGATVNLFQPKGAMVVVFNQTPIFCYEGWQLMKIMNLNTVISIGSIFLFISHGSDGKRKDLRVCHNNHYSIQGCREEDLGWNSSVSGSDLGQDGEFFHSSHPLILTQYIRKKKYLEGIQAAKVRPFAANIESYSGFFEANKQRKSYMFFWYFPPLFEEYFGQPRMPVIMWIQGGTGESGMFAALRENGPIRLKPDGKTIFNEWSWAERAHLVYFDSPVGTGYSFTKSGKYPTTQVEVATDLYIALRQFLKLFRLAENPFYIVGQGYAGKTVPLLGAMIHKWKNAFYINIQGVAIGNGFVDPPNMLGYGKLLYQLGFIDDEVRDELHDVHNKIQAFLKKNMEMEAIAVYTEYIQHNPQKRPPFIDSVTELVSKLDFTQVRRKVNEENLLDEYLNDDFIQGALHATGIPFTKNNSQVLRAIWPDLLKSQVHNLKLLMNKYRVLLYHGQMSITNAYPLVLEYLKKIRWRDGKRYRHAKRVRWRVNGELAGYFKTGGRFTELLMRNAGCRVSADQPKWAQHMINKFIYDEHLNSE